MDTELQNAINSLSAYIHSDDHLVLKMDSVTSADVETALTNKWAELSERLEFIAYVASVHPELL